jgi:hypothetical protein
VGGGSSWAARGVARIPLLVRAVVTVGGGQQHTGQGKQQKGATGQGSRGRQRQSAERVAWRERAGGHTM